ncbi:NAD(P)-dependent dehydrogenase (short-subunit alcohol dehydrogenase family) [Nocardioides sp. BE266]|uniref:SDR family oxidoreductase n=1 Tax=Nocardioides sp. BE266 TaxID=2817725 RepID=UPI00285EF81E|nr:SDR family oxidoreductase [Nocardioides sp. BE266]MDR7255131.1 NAD(P)-dependent dehydrogenase (short-subunit alcohol dehydrogenase family) [Nocardioides sp. BE266]
MGWELRDKVVLITGAAQGIGAETARRLDAEGARLVLVDVDGDALDAVASSLGSDRAVTAVADVRDFSAMEGAVAAGIDAHGGIDVVVANAGIASYGSVLAVDPETFRRVIDTNVTGVFHTVRACLPSVVERRGYMLVVSSLAAFGAMPGMAAYNASKAGVEHFANALRLEVKHLGVDVGCAHMSWIDTPLVRDARADLTTFGEAIASMPPPLNRTATVESCGRAFVKAIAGRKRHVYVPGWVGAVAQARNLVNSPVGERDTLKHVAERLPRMDEEVRRLGRSTSERNLG